jgi:hypothetical protein
MTNTKPYLSAALFSTLLFLLSASSYVLAQDNSARPRLEEGWLKAEALIDGVMSAAQRSELNTVAFSAAVASLCDGFSLDRDKFMKAMEFLKHEDMVSMSPEEVAYYEHHLMFNYGVAVGLYLAEGSLDQPGFCAEAMAHHNDPEAYIHYWQ